MSHRNEDIFGLRPENRNDTIRPTRATATAFNPFDALGVPAAAMTTEDIATAWRRAHCHLARVAANPPLFPTAAEVNAARDYLRDATASTYSMATAVNTWASHARTFFGERDFGHATAFTATAATPTAGPPPMPASSGGSGRARARPAAAPAAAADDDDDADGDYTPRRPPRTTGASPSTPFNAPGTAANPVSLDSDGEGDGQDEDTATPSTTPSSSGRRPANRSSGRSARAAAAEDPDSSLDIVVGEWRRSTAVPRNAVIARLDARGRLNFRVVARTMAGNLVAGPTATATSFNDIILSGPFAGMSYDSLRALLIRQLSRRRQLGM
jgi:hypothetical protein